MKRRKREGLRRGKGKSSGKEGIGEV